MRLRFRAWVLATCAGLIATGVAQSQSWQLNSGSYSLKSGESTELMDLYWVINCRSQLTAPPQVTIMEGPPDISVTIEKAAVMPRFQQCARPVEGGKLILKAGKVEESSDTMMTVRIKYPTRDGVRERSLTFAVALFP